MKKTFRRILSALLVAVMLVGVAPVGGIDFIPKVQAVQKNENCNNVEACYYDGRYYYISKMTIFRYCDLTKTNEEILDVGYLSTMSIFKGILYVYNGEKVYCFDRKTDRMNLFYEIESYGRISSLYFIDDLMIVSESYNHRIYLLNLDTKKVINEINGSFLDIIDGDLYYQVADDSEQVIYLNKYNLSKKTINTVWQSDFLSVLDYVNYSIGIYDLVTFENDLYFIAGETQGSGRFFYGNLYRIDSRGVIYMYSGGVGTKFILYSDCLYVTARTNKYSGQDSLLKINGDTLAEYEKNIYHIGDLYNGYITNYNGDGLYLYDLKDKKNKYIINSSSILSQNDDDINDYINDSSVNINKSYVSVSYYETYYIDGLIISNPEICIEAGWIDNIYHSIKYCEAQFIEYDELDTSFNENSYIADIWLSRNREKTPENKAIDSMLSQQSTSATIYDDLKSNKDFQEAVFLWTGMKTVFDPEKGIKDIFLSEEDLYEALIFDLVGEIMYGKNEETGNVIIDAANKASSTVGTVTKYKSYIDKIKTITTVPEKNLLEILKEWKFDPKSESFSKFYGMLSDADQTASKWTDNKFIEGIGTIADVSSDVTDFYKRLTSYIMLEDMSEDTVTLLKTLKSQTQNEKFKTALQNAINAYDNVDTVSLVCTMKLTGDITLDVAGAFFDDLSKCSKLYTALRAGYKVGTALCDITMNTSKTVDAYKTCGATKEFINANKAAINVLAEKYLESISNSDAGAYVTAVRAYQYAYEIDMKNAVSFVKKASDEGLVNKAKKLSVHAFNFFFNKDKQTSYESMVDSEKNILNGMELTFSTLNSTWKFDKNYLYTDYPDVYPVYIKKEISQKQYAPNINSLYIDKSGKTMLTWSIPLVFKGDDGEVLTLWGASTFDGVYATEKAGGVTTKYDKAISGTSNTIEMYNKSTFASFDKSYTLSSYANSGNGKIYSAAREASLSNPILKPEIRIASAYESGNAQVMFSIVDETSSRYDSLRYLIYRKTGNGAWVKIDEISRENTRFNGRLTLYKDTTAKKGEKYSYKVVSNMVFDNGIALKSPESETVSIIGGLGIKKVNVNIRKNVPQVRTRSVDEEKYGIELSWEKVNSADGYEIYRVSSYGTVYKLLDTVESDITSYTDYDADQGATYSYVVCPYSNSSGKVYDLTEISQGEIEYKVAEIHSVSVSDITLNYKKSTTLKPTITADEGAEYTVKFSSSNPSVARVDENGKVYAAKKGSATITCTVTDSNGNTVTDTCNVKVKYSFGQWLIVILLFGWIWY